MLRTSLVLASAVFLSGMVPVPMPAPFANAVGRSTCLDGVDLEGFSYYDVAVVRRNALDNVEEYDSLGGSCDGTQVNTYTYVQVPTEAQAVRMCERLSPSHFTSGVENMAAYYSNIPEYTAYWWCIE